MLDVIYSDSQLNRAIIQPVGNPIFLFPLSTVVVMIGGSVIVMGIRW